MSSYTSYGDDLPAEVGTNFLWGDDTNVVSDCVSIKEAFRIMNFNYKYPMKTVKTIIPDELVDFEEKNMNIVKTFFKKNTLDKKTCAQLGLSKEWLTPKERGEEEVEFNEGRKKKSGSTLNFDG